MFDARSSRSAFALVLTALGLATIALQAGCFLARDCPEPEKVKLRGETFEATEVIPEHEMSKLPTDSMQIDRVVVDQKADIVEMTYTRDGEQIVVTWGITDADTS